MARVERAPKKTLLELVGLGSLESAFSRAFGFMEIAEEEILEACRRHPDATKALWNSFGAVQPHELADAAPEVYRHHVREILARVVDGADLRPGTRAEVCWMISKMTLATRLQRDVELLGLSIADEIFKGHGLLDGAREDYPGSLREVEAEFRRKLAQPERRTREEQREPPEHFLEQL